MVIFALRFFLLSLVTSLHTGSIGPYHGLIPFLIVTDASQIGRVYIIPNGVPKVENRVRDKISSTFLHPVKTPPTTQIQWVKASSAENCEKNLFPRLLMLQKWPKLQFDPEACNRVQMKTEKEWNTTTTMTTRCFLCESN